MPFELPPLPYSFDALEPYIDARTMEIHHDKHHQAYVTNANAALEGTALADASVEDVLRKLDTLPADKQGPVRNNAGGHYNHSLFWEIMGPGGGGDPTGDLLSAIERDFGSVDALRTQINAAGVGRFGSGWSWLVVDGGKLAVVSSPNQDSPVSDGQDADPRDRRLGARLLPELPEPPSGLPGGLVERRQLGRRRRQVRRRAGLAGRTRRCMPNGRAGTAAPPLPPRPRR